VTGFAVGGGYEAAREEEEEEESLFKADAVNEEEDAVHQVRP